jgi:hypothetical protein
MPARKAFGKHYTNLQERNAAARKLRAEGWSVASSATSNPFTGERTYVLEAWTGDRRPDVTMSDASGTHYGWIEEGS